MAEALSDIGFPQLNRSTVASIESGRRSYVTVDELFALAEILNTTPMALAGDRDPASDLAEARALLNEAAQIIAPTRSPDEFLLRVEDSGQLTENQMAQIWHIRSASALSWNTGPATGARLRNEFGIDTTKPIIRRGGAPDAEDS